MKPAQHIIHFFQEKIGHSTDAKFQTLQADGHTVQLIFITTICDTQKLQNQIVVPFYTIESTSAFRQYLVSLDSYVEYKNEAKALQAVLRGAVLMLFGDAFLLIECRSLPVNEAQDIHVETTIQGPQKALSEDGNVNINLIRLRYHQASLTVERPSRIGKADQMGAVILYDHLRAKREVVDQVKDCLSSIQEEIIQSVGELQRQFTKQKRTLFPVFMITERPDRIAYNLAKGKVVILVEGNPFAMIVPAVFFDFISAMEDFYQPYWISRFLVSLRYIGLFLSLILPSAYVGITSFNPEVLRVQLALSIAGSRVAVPYPSYLEVFFMLLMMELLVEASIRLPKTIGSTATTVGGLILGQAAVEAGLVSNIMIIIVGSVAISNFVIPINEMSFAMRIVKYLLLLLTTLTGLMGLIVGMIGLVLYLAHIRSFQEPYLRVAVQETPRQALQTEEERG